MRIFLTIVVGLSLMTLASGTVAYILHDPTFGGGLILAAAWASFSAKAVGRRRESWESIAVPQSNAKSYTQQQRR